jgi:hypothetical protein
MLEEKLKEVIIDELKRRAANRPHSLKVFGEAGCQLERSMSERRSK